MNEIVEAFIQAVELIVTLDPLVMEITARSLIISFSATLIATAIAIPLGFFIQIREFYGKKMVINLIQTLYALPTVIVGLFVFVFISRAGPLGFVRLLFTPTAMIIAQTILILPIMTGLTIAALSGVDPTIRDTIRSLGANTRQYLGLLVREARFAIFAAIMLGFSRAISEVGAAIMIGGNTQTSAFWTSTRVLTTAISLETSMGNIEFSMALGIILLSIALVVNLVMTRVQQQ
jgi:tungstate transport system permease protein